MATRMSLTTADLIVLSVLIRGGAMHGYEVWQRLSDSDVGDWASVSRAQVYYSLAKLQKTRFLKRLDADRDSKGPERTTVCATPAAAKAVAEALATPGWTRRDPPSPFTTWSALARSAGHAVIDDQFARRRTVLNAEIDREEATLAMLEKAAATDADVGHALAKMAIARMRAELNELDALEQALLSGKNSHKA